MARIPSSCHGMHRSLRISDLREGDDSPLRTLFRPVALGACYTQQLSTPRLRRCGLNATSQTRSQPCVAASSQPLSDACRDVHVARLQLRDRRGAKNSDTVVSTRLEALKVADLGQARGPMQSIASTKE